MNQPTRRTALALGGGTLALGVAACGSSDTPATTPAAGSTPASTPAGGSGGGTPLASVSDIPVGGGVVYPDAGVVVTQPTAGEIKVLSAKCTHKGCPVKDVVNGTINCPCHGSAFTLTGAVANGPASEPLPEVKATVADGKITLS